MSSCYMHGWVDGQDKNYNGLEYCFYIKTYFIKAVLTLNSLFSINQFSYKLKKKYQRNLSNPRKIKTK